MPSVTPTIRNLLALMLSSGVSVSAMAQDGQPRILKDYWGVSLQYMAIDSPGIAAINPTVPTISIGHHVEPGLALELQIGLPSTEETVRWNGQSAKQKVNSLYTGRLRNGFINYHGFELYGSLGLTYTSVSTAVAQNNVLDSTQKETMDVSYGVGTRFRLGGSARLTGHIEYNRLLTLTNYGIGSLSAGINYYF